jgi:hypothetical protein
MMMRDRKSGVLWLGVAVIVALLGSGVLAAEPDGPAKPANKAAMVLLRGPRIDIGRGSEIWQDGDSMFACGDGKVFFVSASKARDVVGVLSPEFREKIIHKSTGPLSIHEADALGWAIKKNGTGFFKLPQPFHYNADALTAANGKLYAFFCLGDKDQDIHMVQSMKDGKLEWSWANVFSSVNDTRTSVMPFCVTREEEFVMSYDKGRLGIFDKAKGLVELIDFAPKPTGRAAPPGVRVTTVRTRPLDLDRVFCMDDKSFVMMTPSELVWFKRDGTLIARKSLPERGGDRFIGAGASYVVKSREGQQQIEVLDRKMVVAGRVNLLLKPSQMSALFLDSSRLVVVARGRNWEPVTLQFLRLAPLATMPMYVAEKEEITAQKEHALYVATQKTLSDIATVTRALVTYKTKHGQLPLKLQAIAEDALIKREKIDLAKFTYKPGGLKTRSFRGVQDTWDVWTPLEKLPDGSILIIAGSADGSLGHVDLKDLLLVHKRKIDLE